METGHHSSSWALCPPTALLEFLLKLEERLKGWDNNGLGNLAEFLCYDFSSFE
jgi:hypothetical protein